MKKLILFFTVIICLFGFSEIAFAQNAVLPKDADLEFHTGQKFTNDSLIIDKVEVIKKGTETYISEISKGTSVTMIIMEIDSKTGNARYFTYYFTFVSDIVFNGQSYTPFFQFNNHLYLKKGTPGK